MNNMKLFKNNQIAILLIVLVALSGCLNIRLPKVIITREGFREKLTWVRVVQEALRHNPDLEKARLDVKAASLGRDIAFGDYLPSVDASMTRSHTKPTAASSKPTESQSYELEASHALFTGFRTTAEFLKAKRELESAKFNYQVTSSNVRFSLRSAFVEVIKQKRLLDVNQKIAKRKRQNADMIDLRYEAGREHQGSLLRAQAIYQQANFEVSQTGRKIESKSLLLGRYIGGNFMTPFPVDGELEEMFNQITGAKPDFTALAEKVPQVQTLVKTAESLKAAVVSAGSTVLPQVSGTYSYGYAGQRFDSLRDNASISVTASVPLFNGGKNIEAIQKAQMEYRVALQRAESARNQAISDLSDIWSGLEDAKEFVGVRWKFLEAARKRADIVRAQYEAGLINYQDFDTTEQELSGAEQSYIQSLSDALTQEANWNLVQGNTLEDAVHVQ